jgi:23S rRNA (cytosine1962-C5)-methyltransferase
MATPRGCPGSLSTGKVGVIHADSLGLVDKWLPPLRADLGGVVESAYAKIHPPSASRLSDAERRSLAPSDPLWGARVEVEVVAELGVRYEIRPSTGLSVGLFLDMREVRAWLREVTRGRSVLNLFAYTCSMGVCASLGGARRVVNLDLSRPYLEWGKRNYALNAIDVYPRDFIYGDAFDWLRRFARRSEHFDLVVVDPPSFSSTPFSITRDYARLVEAAARVVSQGGTLLAATNHAPTTDERFEAWLYAGLDAATRQGEIVRRWHEPEPDFPLAPGQQPYLKVRAVALD